MLFSPYKRTFLLLFFGRPYKYVGPRAALPPVSHRPLISVTPCVTIVYRAWSAVGRILAHSLLRSMAKGIVTGQRPSRKGVSDMSMTGVSATYQQSPYSPVTGGQRLIEELENRPLTPPSECNPLIKQAFRAVCAQAGETDKSKR